MSLEVEGYIRGQTELFGRISRAFENLRKAGAAKLSLGMMEARLQALETNWAKFEAQHDKLLALPGEARGGLEYFKQDVSSKAEEAFLQQKGLFLDTIRATRAKEGAASSAASAEATAATPRTILPRIQLPLFSGRYEDWPSFRDLFLSIIGKDASTTKVEKLHYLKTSLKGEADLLIRTLATTGENYDRAWSTLSSYYENKRLLVRAYLANFVSLPKMRSESAVELRKIFHGVKSTVGSLASIGRAIDRSEDLFVHLAVELLDSRSRREWENSLSDTSDPPSYDSLEQFLDRRLHTLESLQPVKPECIASKSRIHLAHKQGVKAEARRARYSLCQGDHIMMFCEEYRKKTASERKQLVEEKGLCLNCLGRHKVSECSSKRDCSACGARHHSSIHDACCGGGVTVTSHLARNPAPKGVTVLLATARVRVADHCGTWHQARALID